MKASNRFSIHFKIRLERLKEGFVPVMLGLTANGTNGYISLKNFKVELDHWDKVSGRGRANTKQGKLINNYLEEVKVTIRSHYRDLELSGTPITFELLKDAFLGNTSREQQITFSELFKYHNLQAKVLLAESTLSHYFVTQRYLVKFLKENFKKEDISLEILDYKFISDFEIFLLNHKPTDHQKPLNTNGVLKHFVRLKKMTNLALSLDWIAKDPFRGFKMKRKKVEKDFLHEWELAEIENKEFEIERLAVIRDMFVFSCYTGLAYIDMINLTPDHIVRGLDGELWIKTHRQKTSIPVNTPLLEQAQRLILKHKDSLRSQINGTIFPVISNQKVNSYLKEIADLCGIKKHLTFHMARHTFATTVTLSNGVPIETVSKMLGHTKIATTQIYARVLEQKIGNDMAALKNKLSNKFVL